MRPPGLYPVIYLEMRSQASVLLAEAVERRAGADIEARIADGWSAETGIVQIVLGEHLPIGVRPEYCHLTAFAQDVDLAVAGHGRGPVAVERPAQAVYLQR